MLTETVSRTLLAVLSARTAGGGLCGGSRAVGATFGTPKTLPTTCLMAPRVAGCSLFAPRRRREGSLDGFRTFSSVKPAGGAT